MFTWARKFQRRQYVKGSLWVLPLVGAVIGVLLAGLDQIVDTNVQLPPDWQYSSSTASGVLTAIIGAMIGLLGFVVTVSVLVVQQATGSLSPRYMRLWYRDRMQKVVLAVFAGTFTFSFGLLRRIESDFVPDIGVTVAGIAVGASLVLLLVYVNRFTHSLRPVAVAAVVTKWGQRVLADLAQHVEAESAQHPDMDVLLSGKAPLLRVTAPRAGAIQAISEGGLVSLARQHDCIVVLAHSVGDFVPSGAPLLEVFEAGPNTTAPNSKAPDSKAPDTEALQGMVAYGTERTIEQDPAFALRILVDIAIRALSPAVNDPTTAVQVLDYIEELIRSVATMQLRFQYVLVDAERHLRVVVPGRSWEAFLELAFTEIIDYGGASQQVCRRLRAVLDSLAESVLPERRPAVLDELRRLDESLLRRFGDEPTRTFAGTSDRQGIGGRSAKSLIR